MRANFLVDSSCREYNVLPAEEQLRLHEKWKNTGKQAYLDKLILSNMRLVVSQARKVSSSNPTIMYEDLLQEGLAGLLQAAIKFDNTNLNANFSSYARWWVCAYIKKFVMSNKSIIKIGSTTSSRALFINMSKARKEAEALGLEGRALTEKIAEIVGVSVEDVDQMMIALYGYGVELDKPISQGEGKESVKLQDTISDDAKSVDAMFKASSEDEYMKLLADGIASLPDDEREIINSRYLSNEPETLRLLGKKLGMSREWVRKLEIRALERLKKFMGREFEVREY